MVNRKEVVKKKEPLFCTQNCLQRTTVHSCVEFKIGEMNVTQFII